MAERPGELLLSSRTVACCRRSHLLSAPTESVRRSTQGKIAAATQQTSAEYLKPLFKSLRKRELAPDVLLAIAEITYNMQIREYLKANDSYLRLSIGNAPWPIGVTMVSPPYAVCFLWPRCAVEADG
jgi:hypothetical protein